jgi:hypothetical protein
MTNPKAVEYYRFNTTLKAWVLEEVSQQYSMKDAAANIPGINPQTNTMTRDPRITGQPYNGKLTKELMDWLDIQPVWMMRRQGESKWYNASTINFERTSIHGHRIIISEQV